MEGFQKKSHIWDIVLTGREGVQHLEFSVPASLSVLTPKIDLLTWLHYYDVTARLVVMMIDLLVTFAF